MIKASIDIGSNSVLLLVADFANGFQELANESTITGLGKDLDKNGYFCEESMQDTFEALKAYANQVQKHNLTPGDVIVSATEASRVATNAQKFFSKVYDELKIKVNIITSQAEANYSAKGIIFNSRFNSEKIKVMDIGGASTEIIHVDVKSKVVDSSFSMPIGSVRVTNWLSEESFKKNKSELINKFKSQLNNSKCDTLYCVAGTMTSLGNMFLGNKEYQEQKVHNLKIESSEVARILSDIDKLEPSIILERYPFLGKRANTIKGGLIIAQTVLEELEVKQIIISTYGLRYGTISEGKFKAEELFKD